MWEVVEDRDEDSNALWFEDLINPLGMEEEDCIC